ncbi:unnamed protein product, partial [Brassica rapa subsp. narinosa]
MQIIVAYAPHPIHESIYNTQKIRKKQMMKAENHLE